MNDWNSLDEILDAFSLKKPSSFQIARTQLSKLLVEYHPDRSSGSFGSEESKNYYHLIQGAIEYIKSCEVRKSNSLPSVVEATAQLPTIDEKIKSADLSIQIRKIADLKARKTRTTSALVAVSIAAILSFSKSIIAHPLIGRFIGYMDAKVPMFIPMLGAAFLVIMIGAACVFVRAWTREQKATTLTEHLITDSGIVNLFESYHIRLNITSDGKFLSTDMINAIRSEYELVERWYVKMFPALVRKKIPNRWRYYSVQSIFSEDHILAQQAVDIILAKLEGRGVITPVKGGSIVPAYELSDAARAQLR
ncbi:MAG TPA: hypothetical protein VM689_06970 [Aliidongia sp.]|nr:hypothetical protein [Aliidongia sp.]